MGNSSSTKSSCWVLSGWVYRVSSGSEKGSPEKGSLRKKVPCLFLLSPPSKIKRFFENKFKAQHQDQRLDAGSTI